MIDKIKKVLGFLVALVGFFGLFADVLEAYGLLVEMAWLLVCFAVMAFGCKLAGLVDIFATHGQVATEAFYEGASEEDE